MACFGLLLAATFGCARSSVPASYPMWQPLSPQLPTAPSSQLALSWLEQSRGIWRAMQRVPETDKYRQFGVPGARDDVVRYSYVRALQISTEEVEFTAFSVENGRVILRPLLTADPRRLRMNRARQAERYSVATRWIERGADVGARDEGAPALTVDALYEKCAALLAQHAQGAPRLYFHPDGLLMSCGYPDGESVSIQSLSRYPLFPQVDPADQLCSEPWGLFPPLADERNGHCLFFRSALASNAELTNQDPACAALMCSSPCQEVTAGAVLTPASVAGRHESGSKQPALRRESSLRRAAPMKLWR